MTSIHSYKFSMEETARYATLADEAMSASDTVVLNGHGCGLRVMNKALHVKQGSLLGADREPIIYYKGTATIKTIVLMGKSGMISLEALHWCKEQSISIVMLDGIGNLFYSLSPEGESNAKLRRLQYEAVHTGMSSYIAREVVKRKTLAQIAVLKDFPWLQDDGETIPILISGNMRVVLHDSDRNKMKSLIREILEDSLHDLSSMKDIAPMLGLEGRNANYYWGAYVGIPLHWRQKDEKLVRPHWRVITERPLSLSGVSARRAICPFHAALNYLYGVAEHLLLCAIRAAGLDPACAFLHADHAYRDSLIYDLIEEHRAEIDKKVLEFFERTTLQRGDITMLPMGQIMLNKELSRYMIISCLPDPRKLGDTVMWLVKTLTGKHPNWMTRLDL
jgi:CRISPR-associated protein Cas1